MDELFLDENVQMDEETIKFWINYNLEKRAEHWLASKNADHLLYEKHANAEIPHSDLNAARQIFHTFKNQIHYLPASSSWYVWNHVYHERIEGDLLAKWLCGEFVDQHKRALSEVKEHYEQLAKVLTADQAKKMRERYSKDLFKEHRAFRDRIHSDSGIKALVSQIKDMFSVSDKFFDNDRDWLVVKNGVIDLKDLRKNPPRVLTDIKLLPHDESRPVWRSMKAEFLPNKVSPTWTKFLVSSQPDPSLRQFLAVITGAAVLGQKKTKIIPVLKGPMDSGKTIFLKTMDDLFDGYGTQPATGSLNKAKGDTNFEQDAFKGMRFVGISEPNTSSNVDDSFLKKFTGGDIIMTRNLRDRSAGWESQGILFIATNNDLKYNSSDKAILERFATIEFPNQFFQPGQVPEGQEDFIMDLALEESLSQEFDGILNWILSGVIWYLYEGIKIPDSVLIDRSVQFIEGSTVRLWVEESLKSDGGTYFLDPVAHVRPKSHYATVGALHMDYSLWAIEEYNKDPLGKHLFSKELAEYLGTEVVNSGGKRIPLIVAKDVLEAVNQ